MKPYTPSKACPHRYCPHMHSAVTWITMGVGLTQVLWMQIITVLLILLKLYNWHERRRLNLPAFQPRNERPNQYLIVRPWWARAAVALDVVLAGLMLLLASVTIMVHAFGRYDEVMSSGYTPRMIIGLVIGVLITLGFLGLIALCHWMATKPGKPKKVRVPWGTSFQGA